jgi:hypothetical protein
MTCGRIIVVQIVGIVGKCRSGKDTLADGLVARYGAIKIGFAMPIIQEVAEILGISPEQIEADKEAYRRPLQDYGDKLRREFPNHWIDKLESRINAHLLDDPQARIVIPGIRLLAEANWLENHNAFLVRILNANCDLPQYDHVTETEQDLIAVNVSLISLSSEETYGRWADAVACYVGWTSVIPARRKDVLHDGNRS